MHLIKTISRLKLIDVILIITSFLLIVFPNSFREIKFPLLLIIFIISLNKLILINKKVFIYYFAGVIITLVYLIIGINDSKDPNESTSQVAFIYIIAPFMWISISNYVLDRYSISTIIKGLNTYAVIGSFTIFLGIWLFDIGRLDLLEYIIDNPNKTLTDDGIIEMKLFVYGGLIFLIPAFIQLNKSYTNSVKYFMILLFFFISTVISGRSALLLSFFVGFFFFIILNKDTKIIKYIIWGFVIFVISIFILESFDINILKILYEFNKKVLEGNDKERYDQIKALFEGINNNILGAGHGVGVSYIRSYEYPWRYEVLPLALIYRVGILGFIIYTLPFLFSIFKFLKLKKCNDIDKYMMVGLISILIGSFTNPYLESFEFNLFYVLPFIYFTKRND